jgi:peroxiredoxin
MKQPKGKPLLPFLFLLSLGSFLLVNCENPYPSDGSDKQKETGRTARHSASGSAKKAPADVPDTIIPAAGSAADAVKSAPAGVSSEAGPEPVPVPGWDQQASRSALNAPDYSTQPAPDFALNDMDGNEVRLSDMRGRVVVLNFFATWCRYCVNELPELDSAESAFRKENMVLFLISSEPKEVLERFMREKGYSFSVLLDNERRVSSLYDISGIPRTLLIGKKGELLYSKSGEIRSVEQDLIARLPERQSRKRY